MLTNVIAYLHTSFAYQSAAMQLMVGQANFDAQQLHLRETLPITVPANTNTWNVASPPDGIAGGFSTSNYIYRFAAGELATIQRKPHPRGTAADAEEFKPSLIDTNSAYELAKQWLAGMSVDVATLEKFPHHVESMAARLPVAARFPRSAEGTNRAPEHAAPAARQSPGNPPIFRVSWGGRSPVKSAVSSPVQITVEILGSTKQCIGLRIQNPDLLKTPPLQVANADKLLGVPPAPQHYVQELFGGASAFETVARPDRVSAWLLHTDEAGNSSARTPAVALDAGTSAQFSSALTDFNSYSWLEERGGVPGYQAVVRFTKGADNVDFMLSFDSDHLVVTHNQYSAEKDFDAAHTALVRAIKSVFPKDEIVSKFSQLPSQPN
jgi:hypothetical protein